MVRCIRCGCDKPEANFQRYRTGKLDRKCKACRAELSKERRNGPQRAAILAAERIRMEARRRLNTEAIWRYLLTHPCVDCGEPDPVVLEFDHVYGQKLRPVASMTISCSWMTIAAEIEKCEVRCANCHRRKTATQLGWYAYMTPDALPLEVL